MRSARQCSTYLDELRAGLELGPEEAGLVVAEAEDHLRETASCGLAAGMTEYVGVSGLAVLLMNLALGRAFTGQAPPGVSFRKADCAYWMGLWPGARTCAAAQMLEASSDAVVLRAGAGVLGVALLAGYGVVRYVQRRRGRGPVVVLAGYFPLLGLGVICRECRRSRCRATLETSPSPLPLPDLQHHLHRVLAEFLRVLPLCSYDPASSQGSEPPRFPG
jgi:hypothetical protein